METPRPTTLYLLCGKIAAGKSTLARQLASRAGTLLIDMDQWMSTLFPVENRTIEDFTRLSARLREAMKPHVIDILREGLSVVLDFPANTVKWRSWMRSLIDKAHVAHELHFLDVSDAICKTRLLQRNASGDRSPGRTAPGLPKSGGVGRGSRKSYCRITAGNAAAGQRRPASGTKNA